MPGIKSTAENLKIVIKNRINNIGHITNNQVQDNLEDYERKDCCNSNGLEGHAPCLTAEKTPGSYAEATNYGENGRNSSCKHIVPPIC